MRINIYLTEENSTKLNAMTHKYQVSKSTIAENVLFYLTKYLTQEFKTEIRTQLGKEYVQKNMGKKTCIKPKKNACEGCYENLTKAYTNALWIYLNRKLEEYIEKQDAIKMYNELNTMLQKINEPNWDYNHFVRQMARYEQK